MKLYFKKSRRNITIITHSLIGDNLFVFVLVEEFIGLDPTPGLDDFLQHSIDVKLAADFNVGYLIAFLDIEPEPVDNQETLNHVAVHADLGVDFVELFEGFANDHREYS